jgi:hypothetical protein
VDRQRLDPQSGKLRCSLKRAVRSHASATVESSPRDKAALGVVDTALAFATRRELFTADEALDVLRRVRNLDLRLALTR